MKRILFRLCVAAYLAICIALIVLWARSYHVGHGIACQPSARTFVSAYLSCGRLRIDGAQQVADGGRYLSHESHRPPHPIATYGARARYGIWYDGRPSATGRPRFAMVTPVWVVALLAAVPPAWHLGLRLHRRRRQRRGCCMACGYDLRATSHRCPECGLLAAKNSYT